MNQNLPLYNNTNRSSDRSLTFLIITIYVCWINMNFWSVLNKKAEFLNLIDLYQPHVITGTETWVSNFIVDNEVIPAKMNYTIFQKDWIDGYGGAMIAVSERIQSVPLPDLQTSCKVLWVKLKCQKCRDLYLGAFYRPHVSD